MTVSLVIAAGGTGGHLVPALAVAAAVRRADPSASIVFVGTPKGMESELVPAAGFRLHTTNVRPLNKDARGLLAPGSLVPATAKARRILRSERASVVLGMGGYPSLPVVAAARMLKIPTVLHEANVVPGLANDLASRFTPNIAVSFPDARGAFRNREPRVVGMPLRPEIARLDRAALRDEAVGAFALDGRRRTLLVAGGSLGAARLNAAVTGLARAWAGRDDVQILWSAGRAHHERISGDMPEGKLIVRALPFIDRMDLAYAVADAAVCRSGASTVAELAAVGMPSILVPLPFARRREQHANAKVLVGAGGAILLEDAACTADGLARMLDDLLGDADRLGAMREGAASVALPNASDDLAAWVLELGARRD